MPRPHSINPKTGKRYAWEAEQAARKAAAPTVDHTALQDAGQTVREQLALVRRQEAVVAARGHLLDYMRLVMPDPERPSDASRSLYEPAKVHEVVADVLTKFVKGTLQHADGRVCRQLIFCMPPRHGKACAHDTPVLTPDGWRKHGDLKAGDRVFGPDGRPTLVLAVSADVDEVVPVTLSNGDVVRCHLNHEWTVYDRACGAWRTLETRQIAARALRSGPQGRRGGRHTIQLPNVAALEFPEADLPLEPYVLGAWLGDGSAGAVRIAHAQGDREVVDAIEHLGHVPSRRFMQPSTGVAYASFGGPRPGVGSRMHNALKTLGVLRDKHIPEAYLRASKEQRLGLLAGLVDTDGHVEPGTGRVRFSTCSEKLRDGVVDLATTLGFRPYVSVAEPTVSSSGIVGKRRVYQVGFQPTESIPTRVPRKRVAKFATRRRVAIVHVGAVEKAGARSIRVDRPDGLYVVGRSCVATHNTQLATKGLAAWASGLHPEWDIGIASYSDTMATDFGADIRAFITSAPHRQAFPGYRLRKGGGAKDNIQTEAGGRLVAVGRGGALTGRGMCLGLGDDLFKDHEEARSPAIRDAAWHWFVKVFMTRRMGPKLVMLTMTRWHSDDVIGRLTDPKNPNYNEDEARNWMIIRLPAIAEHEDPLGREPGEALWPERYDLDFLASQQRLDALGFAALYQQRPTVADGVLFRRENIRRYHPHELPEDLRFYCASDHAVGTKQRNDPSCFGKAGVDRQDNLWLTDLFWQRVPTDRAVEAMLTMAGGNARPLLWWAEAGHISKSIGPFLRKRMLETGQYINIVEINPTVDKEQRAQSIAARVAMGKVLIPHGHIWDQMVEEMLEFPNGLHDDAVDMLSLFGMGLGSQFGARPAPPPPKAPQFGTLAWVKEQDRWANDQRRARAAGGF